jgi:hypothetical protein
VSNALALPAFPNQEIGALKSRLAEATIALDRIEAAVVAIAKDAPADVHVLAATVLQTVLASADNIRPKESGFTHEWEREAYAAYETTRRHTAGALNYALVLIARTVSLYER